MSSELPVLPIDGFYPKSSLKNYDPNAYPKLVALDTDWTLFSGDLDSYWGRGSGASETVEDNIEKIENEEIRDRSNHSLKCRIYDDVPKIINELVKNGVKLAIVSRNPNKNLCDRALWHWTVPDAQGNQKPLIELVEFDEVYDEPKTNHFEKIKGWTNFDYSDMILYDDDATSEDVEMMLGVTFQLCRDQKGLTWDIYRHGLELWRRNKAMHSPWLGPDKELYEKKKLIGYSGMDDETIKLLQAGGRRIDKKEAARWGYAMYITDNPYVAKFFSGWIKGYFPGSGTQVCAIYARDGDIWDSLPKIWVSESDNSMNSTELRDRKVEESWGVQKPYILFCRHWNIVGGLVVDRFIEMVVYSQIQEALLLTVPMSEDEVEEAIKNETAHLHYEKQIPTWNITVPKETCSELSDLLDVRKT